MAPPASIILQRLSDLQTYVAQEHPSHQSLRFEELVCHAFAAILHLAYYDAPADDPSQAYRVTWLGNATSLSKAPGGPDGIARAHHFSIVIEATLKTGPKQWSQEFNQCLDHAQDVANNNGVKPRDVLTVLVAGEIHKHTFRAVKAQNTTSEFKIALLTTECLRMAVETAGLALTLRHLEVQELLRTLINRMDDASNEADLSKTAIVATGNWQRSVLKLELATALALKSYSAMVKLGRGHVGAGEILAELTLDPAVEAYLKRVEERLDTGVIERSLVQESLGKVLGRDPQQDEAILCPVPVVDFKSRCQRRLQAVEKVHEAS